jgi:hypothetical protein
LSALRARICDRRAREQGQAAVIFVVLLVPVLAFAGFVIDVGYGYHVHRSLQASADASALAGAQELPNTTSARAVAIEYGTSGKNRHDSIDIVSEEITTKCVTTIAACKPVNAVVVEQTARVETLFSRVVGLDDFEISVRSTACSPCGFKPLDVMLVLDRTLSMCMTSSGAFDPSCTDLRNARDGLRTFLGYLDSNTQWVGFGVFPPATSRGTRCEYPQNSNYDSSSAVYTVVPLSSDYLTGDELNQSSDLVKTIDCAKPGGLTAYANALEAAQAELDRNGRRDIQDVIVFFSDGAANQGPKYYPKSSSYRKQPCHQGVWSASTIKSRGTLVFSIGYDLDAENGGANECKEESYNGHDEKPPITAYQAIQQIASPGKFYNQPSPDELETIYTDIAAILARGTSGLIDNDLS